MRHVFRFLFVLLAVSASTAAFAAEEPAFTIRPGDVLQITVWKEEGMDREVLVLPDGTVDFPLIGSLNAKGLTTTELQADVKRSLKKYIPDASVIVVVKAALGHTVNVIGQVTKPGEIVVGRRMTVMQALSQAGGLTPYASEKEIIILRHEGETETSVPVPYRDLMRGQNLENDIVLIPGDVIVVPTATLF